MVISRQPLTPTARIASGALAAICLAGSGLASTLAVTRQNVGLFLLALPILGLGILYAAVAWRGRPFAWRWQRNGRSNRDR